MLDARNLTKYYAAIPAIRRVSFTVPPGAAELRDMMKLGSLEEVFRHTLVNTDVGAVAGNLVEAMKA